MSQCHGAPHPWSGRGSRRLRIAWNPPTTTRSRTRTGFVFCFSHASCCTSANRRCNVGGGHKVTRASSGAVLTRQLFLRVPESSEFRRPPPARVVRRPCQGRSGSSPGSPLSSCLASVICPPRQSHPQPPLGSSAGPARVIRAVPARVVVRRRCFCERRPRQGRPPSPPGSPAKLFFPARVARQLAVPNQVWQTRSAWQSKQISKR